MAQVKRLGRPKERKTEIGLIVKIQCPNCNKQFKAPDEYEGKKVKCAKCNFVFYAQKIEDKLNELLKKTIQKKPKGQNLFIKIWNNSPIVFRTAFLATLGVISALVIAYLCLDWANTIKKAPSKSKWLSADVYSIAMLYTYAGDFESMQNTRCLICDVISKNPKTASYVSIPKVFESMKERLELLARQLTELKISQNNDDFEKVKSLYIESTYAERDVINDLINGLRTMNFDSDYEQKIKKANSLTSTATLELAGLLFKLDPEMANSIQKLQKK